MSLFNLSACSDKAPKDKLLHLPHSTFHVKVIDQDGQPVSGVEATMMHGGNYYFGSNIGMGEYVSDGNGMLFIEIDDRQITLKQIHKPGYRFNWGKTQFVFREGRSYPVPAQGDLWPVDMKQFNARHPFIIQAWRIDPAEQVASCINGRVFSRLHADGRVYGLDFLRNGKNTLTEGMTNAHISVSFSREHVDKLPRQDFLRNEIIQRTDWRYTLEVINGGIQEIKTGTLFKKKPPTSGYVKRWELDRHNFRPRYSEYGGASHEDDRHFYVKLGKQVYGRLSVRFKPMGSTRADHDNAEITIDYSINTEGSGYVQDADERQLQRNSKNYRNNSCT